MTRDSGYDLLRTLAILLVFVDHAVSRHATDHGVLIAIHSLSPGLTMSALGCLSGLLLAHQDRDPGTFVIRRLTRLYLPLWLCMAFLLAWHGWLGERIAHPHALIHLLGLSAALDLTGVKNVAVIGAGLWFVTVILLLSLLLPLFHVLFKSRAGLLILGFMVLACAVLDKFVGAQSTWNVVISFAVGVYLVVNEKVWRFRVMPTYWAVMGFILLIGLAACATTRLIPYEVRSLLYGLYPLVAIPLCVGLASVLPRSLLTASGIFAAFSYEFYLLHSSVMDLEWWPQLPQLIGMPAAIGVAFVLTVALAYVISRLASSLRQIVERSLMPGKGPEKGTQEEPVRPRIHVGT